MQIESKAYDINDNIIYDMENINGKGKEFNNYGELKFEGEYLNGKRNGKGKEYYYEGTPKFEGEYLNGIRNIKEKEFYKNSFLVNG